MVFRKKLTSGDTVETWSFDTDIATGIAVGVFDRTVKRAQMIVCVEESDGKKRIAVNEAGAAKYGFEVVRE